MKPSPDAIFTKLRQIAPDIAYSVYWDLKDDAAAGLTKGQLRHMRTEGYQEHVVEVYAVTVVNDDVHEGRAYMTGFFYAPGKVDPDLDGWLPHLLWNATVNLANSFPDRFPQAEAALRYLNRVRKEREKARRAVRFGG